MLFCEYKDIFGKPKEGFHAKRIFGLAFNDLIGTIIIAIIIAWYKGYSKIKTIINLLIIGEISHYLFCVETPITKILN